MVKDLVRTRSYITRFIEMKTQLNAVSLKLQVVKSQEAMSTAMKGVTKALGMMNKKMDIPGLQKIMAEFMRENEKAEFVQESMGDAIDDALEEPGSAEEEDRIVGQVMAEIGISMGEDLKEAPVGSTAAAPVEEKTQETAGLSELEERLNNLRRT